MLVSQIIKLAVKRLPRQNPRTACLVKSYLFNLDPVSLGAESRIVMSVAAEQASRHQQLPVPFPLLRFPISSFSTMSATEGASEETACFALTCEDFDSDL